MDILIVMETLFCFFLVCFIEDSSLRGYNLDVGNKQQTKSPPVICSWMNYLGSGNSFPSSARGLYLP